MVCKDNIFFLITFYRRIYIPLGYLKKKSLPNYHEQTL